MNFSRRNALKMIAVLGSAALSGCEKAISFAAKKMGQTIPETITVTNSSEVDPDFHLLSRAGYGPWPGDIDRLRKMGAEQWIEEQLHPQNIDDSLCDLRANACETISHHPSTCFEYKRPFLRQDLARYTLLRAVYSRRQLLEVMVGFWSDHFNISVNKGKCIYFKATDDRTVIRPHALGKFRDLVRASAVSPAMLVYLDGKENKRIRPGDIPNENYARELLELHTMGVHGGYTQKDVYEVARCLTGWSVGSAWQQGQVYFAARFHDDGSKQVLGKTIASGGGEEDLESVLDIVCSHPSTARHIATKMVRRFVADDPPASLVDRTATVFLQQQGDIKAMLRTIFTSAEFRAATAQKFKRPFRYIVSILRLLAADTHAHRGLLKYLETMGQPLFEWPTPDGYPDEFHPWLGTMLWRWNFALAVVADKVPSVRIPLRELARSLGIDGQSATVAKLYPYLLGRLGSKVELEAIEDYLHKHDVRKNAKHRAELLGLILASPAFQRY